MDHPSLTLPHPSGDPVLIHALAGERFDLNAAVIDQIGSLVIVLDREGRIVRFNRACETLSGYRFADLRHRPFWDFLVPPDELEQVQAVFGTLRMECYPNHLENHWLCADGSRRLISWHNTAVGGTDGSVAYVIGTGTDITELRHVEEQLHQRVEEADAIATVSSALNSSLEPAPLYHLILAQAARILPCDHAEVILYEKDWAEVGANWGEPKLAPGTRLFRLQGEQDHWTPDRHDRPIYIEDTDRMPEWRHVAPFTGPHTMRSVITFPLVDEGKVVGSFAVRSHQPSFYTKRHLQIATTLSQIIVQAVRNARLFAAEKQRARTAEDLAHMQSDFVAAVSHELRTPLTAIIGYAELLKARWHISSEDHRLERLGRIAASAQRQRRLVEDLLLLTQLEVGHLTPQAEPLRIQLLVEGAIHEVQSTYQGQQIDVRGKPATRVAADADRTMQIISNLLDNAAKYSSEGSPIVIGWRQEEDMIAIRVSDRGAGIPENGRERLFTRFGRIPGSASRSGRMGTGLGLYLSRQLATAMKGTLTLERTGPAGSVFCLRLPAIAAEPD